MRLLPAGVPTRSLSRSEFYLAVGQPTTALVIVTGEERRFANLLLTIGVARKEQR
jgi:L-fucose mutarotase